MDIRSISLGPQGLPGVLGSPATSSPSGFNGVMERVLQSVTEPQREADQAVQSLAMGKTDQLHQVLLGVAKADLTFRLMLEVRNRLTEAYQEIQRMQV